MSPYNFRIRFLLQRKQYFDHNESDIEFSLRGGSIDLVLKSYGNAKSMKDSKYLVLIGGPFKTKQEAESFGKKAKCVLMLTAARLRMGFDLGKDKAMGGVTRHIMDKVSEKNGIKLLNDVHGLCVYDAAICTKFASASATASIGTQASRFIEEFTKSYSQRLDLTDKELLAFELYSSSHFESSARARFLTLVMAIETLLKPKPKSTAAQKLVEHFRQMTNDSKLEVSERESLLGSLHWLHDESISKTGRDLVEQHLQGRSYSRKEAKDFFTHCYNLRSELVHEGRFKDKTTNIGTLVAELEKMVADLLCKIVCGEDAIEN